MCRTCWNGNDRSELIAHEIQRFVKHNLIANFPRKNRQKKRPNRLQEDKLFNFHHQQQKNQNITIPFTQNFENNS